MLASAASASDVVAVWWLKCTLLRRSAPSEHVDEFNIRGQGARTNPQLHGRLAELSLW
jgi:hypothetical protein